ncbi:receptor-like serine/threonine-protein kinase ALE2 isoform X4 [Malus domestica]|uniref:receptor-like serine/threonine-protein kinase ALE2 isoform X4 n=1 Tax=Malus domestica TaxID=3750 RepID=UPI00397499D4
MMPAILQLVNLCVIGFAFALQGSAGLNISPSPEPLSMNPPVETAPPPFPDRKPFTSNVPIPGLQPNGSNLHPSPTMPPLMSTPLPPNNAPPPLSIEVHVPSALPNNAPPSPTVGGQVPPMTPNNAPPPLSIEVHTPSALPNNAPSPPSVEGHAPSMPPTNSPPPPSVEDHAPPMLPNNAPPPPSVEGHVPSMPPTNAPPPPSVEGHVQPMPPNNAPPPLSIEVQVPSAPPNDAPPPPSVKGHVPSTPPNNAPPPPSAEGHVWPTPPNNAPPPLSIGVHVPSAPPNNAPPPPSVKDQVPSTPPTNAPPPPSVEGHVPSTPPTVPQTKPAINKSPSSVPFAPVPVETPLRNLPQISPAIHASTPETSPFAHQRHVPNNKVPIPQPIAPDPPVSSTPPSINGKRGRFPVVAPPYEAPKPSLPVDRTPAEAPSVHKPVVSSRPPVGPAYEAPRPSLPKVHTPAEGPVMPPVSFRTGRRRHYAPPPLNPASSVPPSHLPEAPSVTHVSPAPSPSLEGSTHETKLHPKISPSGSLAKSPKAPPPLPLVFPPPPPNQDCSSTICTNPYTNTPPGSPCGCVLPLQVGLRLSVALYTFFPLVSELAQEIAVGVFMQQSQVRIIGANAATQQPDKTVALIDLVPLGEKFDNTTAFLNSQRFWHKQVVIKASYFGDYEVLYVRYPGLPPSPPSSDADAMNAGPYPGNDNNGRTMKPFGIYVHKRKNKNGLSGGVIAIIALSTFVAVALCSAAAWVFLFKSRDRASQPAATPRALLPSSEKPSGTAGSMMESRHSSLSLSFASSIAPYTGSANTFSASDIERATNNYDDSRVLGEGGFGRVYSGVLEDRTKIAVKVLKRDDQQGGREFLAEVEMLSRLHHRNLVKLIGICTEEHSRSLVYELIPNGSVESHLHGTPRSIHNCSVLNLNEFFNVEGFFLTKGFCPFFLLSGIDKDSAPLNWVQRMKIALGAARGLAYLHEDSSPRVIHRDFKASNILLEDDFTPKVSDFGLARTAMDEENRHISTRVMGTFGYVAPEYAMTGHLLVKSDVYSYGVVLLELLTGRKPVDMSQPPGEENLVAWARPLLTCKEGLEAIIDPHLGSEVPFESIAKVAAIASMCVQPEVSHRPFMGEVVQALKLVCNEFDEAKELGSRSSSRDDVSIDVADDTNTTSGRLADTFQNRYSMLTYDSDLETEREASLSRMLGTSMGTGRLDTESFRRHSSSGPLGTGRSKQLWEKLRSSGGSVSEHGFMFKLFQGSPH